MNQRPPGTGSAVNVSSDTPSSSPGDSSIVVTPKDVSPDNATARDLIQRDLCSDNIDQREEALLDDAIELSFPASDPIAIPPCRNMHDMSQTDARQGNPAPRPKP